MRGQPQGFGAILRGGAWFRVACQCQRRPFYLGGGFYALALPMKAYAGGEA